MDAQYENLIGSLLFVQKPVEAFHLVCAHHSVPEAEIQCVVHRVILMMQIMMRSRYPVTTNKAPHPAIRQQFITSMVRNAGNSHQYQQKNHVSG